MRNRSTLPLMLSLTFLLTLAPHGAAAAAEAITPQDLKKLYDRVTPSLVAVQFVWESELGRRELIGAGVVVGDDGLVMASMQMFDMRIPDAQMNEFKIIVPSRESEHEEIDAVFQGRDERTQTSFIRPQKPQKWPVLKFEDSKVGPGDEV